MKFQPMIGLKLTFLAIAALTFCTSPILAQSGNKNKVNKNDVFELYKNQLPAKAKWKGEKEFDRKGGPADSKQYIYVKPSESPAEVTGLSIPIRENPGPGEYRYITFKWVKWGGKQIGIHFAQKNASNSTGAKYSYTYYAGTGDSITRGLKISNEAPGHWVTVTRDLWKDFGNFTITGVSYLCPDRRDAGFDAVLLGKTPDAFGNAPGVLPSQVAEPVDVKGGNDLSLSDTPASDDTKQSQGVQIDWVHQLKAGGIWMYPLYLLGLLAIVISIQRIMTSTRRRLAPKGLRDRVHDALANKDVSAALETCNEYPSTLAKSLSFIFRHRSVGREVVSQNSGDIAARDIREHLDRIYPLSVISSLAPLLGLLGTIIGMIEAFALVAIYGDSGGPSILSDSISKALITTAAGLIIAIPTIAIYFVIKRKIKRLSSVIEEEIENAITVIYLEDSARELTTSKLEEENHANTI